MSRVSLHDIAPRLARARDLLLEIRRRERRARRARREAELKAEWLLAHRELQLVRAQHTGDRRYIKRREHKLKQARKQMARFR